MSNNIRKNNLNQMASLKHVCEICGKGPVSSNTRSHSMVQTKTVVKPNTQRVQGLTVCTRCLRTRIKKVS